MDSVEQNVEYSTFKKRGKILWSCEFGEEVKNVECQANGFDLFDIRCSNYEDISVTYSGSKVLIIGKSRIRKKEAIKLKIRAVLNKITIDRCILVNMI